MLSGMPSVVRPTFTLTPMGGGPQPNTAAYTPAQIAQAYGFNNISLGGFAGTGHGETIAIVDSFDDPNIQSDLNTFDSQFGLPATTVIRVNSSGGTAYPPVDRTGGWELEESLDVEWAHAMAPQATIMLVEANSSDGNDLLAAVASRERMPTMDRTSPIRESCTWRHRETTVRLRPGRRYRRMSCRSAAQRSS
jgi:subtilase family serine protease